MQPALLKSPAVKHSVIIDGRKSSVCLEAPFWDELKSICAAREISLNRLVSEIDASRQHVNLCSALRLFVLASYRSGALPTADVVAVR